MSGNINHREGQMPGNEDLVMYECQKPGTGEASNESPEPDQEEVKQEDENTGAEI